ncbi:MAG: hypothetical protein EKK56_00925 [Flavobacteriaceae bacterium]|nr:MAG: hypothetical protein EKK56_00925 [Flavobacteriaceae bacterium]
MSYFYGGDVFNTALGPYASTTALAAVDMTLQPDGTRAGVTDAGIYQYNKQATTGSVKATGGGYWSLVNDGYLFLDENNIIDPSQVSTAEISLADGTEEAPSLHFASETNTGIYRPGAFEFGITVGGAHKLIASASAITLGTGVSLVANAGTAVNPSITSATNNEDGFYFPSSGNVSVSSAGSQVFAFTSTLNISYFPMIVQQGSVSAPSLAFFTNNDLGIYSSNNQRISFSVDGALVAEATANGLYIPSPNYLAIGNFQVVSTRVLGYVNMAGAENGDASSINTGTITATDANLQGVCRVIKALITALLHHGLIGPTI